MNSLALLCICLLSSPHDWPTYLGPSGNNKSSETGLPSSWPESGADILWKKPIGDGYASPVVVGDKLYVFDRKGDSDRLTCMMAATGKQIWQVSDLTTYEDMYKFSNGPRCAPLIDGDRIYTYAAGGRLNCRKKSDGTRLWSLDVNKKYGVVQNFFGVGASPVIHKDLLLVMVGGSPAKSPGIQTGNVKPNGTAMVAFNKKTGKEVYRFGNDLASYATPVLHQYDGRDWCFVFARGGLIAFDPNKGKTDFFFPWRAKKLESVNAAAPVVWRDQVLVTESYELGSALLKFKPENYKLVRSDKRRELSLAAHWATPILHDGYLYGAHGMGGRSDFRCVSWTTGEVAWTKTGVRHGTPLYVDGHLLITSESGDLRLIKADPGEYKEVFHMQDLAKRPNYTGPVLANGRLFLQSSGSLVCLQLMPTTQVP